MVIIFWVLLMCFVRLVVVMPTCLSYYLVLPEPLAKNPWPLCCDGWLEKSHEICHSASGDGTAATERLH